MEIEGIKNQNLWKKIIEKGNCWDHTSSWKYTVQDMAFTAINKSDKWSIENRKNIEIKDMKVTYIHETVKDVYGDWQHCRAYDVVFVFEYEGQKHLMYLAIVKKGTEIIDITWEDNETWIHQTDEII